MEKHYASGNVILVYVGYSTQIAADLVNPILNTHFSLQSMISARGEIY